jgi:hypothetical protein
MSPLLVNGTLRSFRGTINDKPNQYLYPWPHPIDFTFCISRGNESWTRFLESLSSLEAVKGDGTCFQLHPKS